MSATIRHLARHTCRVSPLLAATLLSVLIAPAQSGPGDILQQPVPAEPKIALIRADLIDAPVPVSLAQLQSLKATLAATILANSYGRTVPVIHITEVVHVPKHKANYLPIQYPFDNVGTFYKDLLPQAAAIGLDLGSYDYRVLYMPRTWDNTYGWTGLSQEGIPVAICSVGGADLLEHELGHNFILEHARFWDDDPTTYPPTGEPLNRLAEYGDAYDIMGQRWNYGEAAPIGTRHFHPRSKALLGWLDPGEYVSLRGAPVGTYQFVLGGLESTPSPSLYQTALELPFSDQLSYWLYYRASQPLAQAGPLVATAELGGATTLLDMDRNGETCCNRQLNYRDAELAPALGWFPPTTAAPVQVRTLQVAGGFAAVEVKVNQQLTFDRLPVIDILQPALRKEVTADPIVYAVSAYDPDAGPPYCNGTGIADVTMQLDYFDVTTRQWRQADPPQTITAPGDGYSMTVPRSAITTPGPNHVTLALRITARSTNGATRTYRYMHWVL